MSQYSIVAEMVQSNKSENQLCHIDNKRGIPEMGYGNFLLVNLIVFVEQLILFLKTFLIF